MKITIFTSNGLRHLHLINKLSTIAKVSAVIESKTLFHGKLDGFFSKTPQHKKYFDYVNKSEIKFFKYSNYLKTIERTLILQQGDLNYIKKKDLINFIKSDIYIVFGASFIKGWLLKFLKEKKAINIHMGISPYYKGSSCNFWALYDKNINMIGSTIHYLSEKLDGGDVIMNIYPKKKYKSGFDYTMRSVLDTHETIFKLIKSKKIFNMKTKIQDVLKNIRTTKKKEFSQKVIKKFFKDKKNIIKF
jgi:methionyl-tRNA formyltransferase